MLNTLLQWLLSIVLIAAALLIHEYAHVFAAKFCGGKIEKVGFFPLGMMAKVRGLELLHWWERYVIYAAGSAANFLVAAMGFTVSRLSYVGVGWLESLAFFSLVIGVFNLTPVLPLDGGRILWQFLGNRVGILRASRFVSKFGLAVSILYVILGVVQLILFPFNFTLLAAGVYLIVKNKSISPELHAAFHVMLGGKNSPARMRTLDVREIPLHPETPIKTALERLAPDYFIVFRIGKRHPLHENTLVNHVFEYGIRGAVKEIMCYSATQIRKTG